MTDTERNAEQLRAQPVHHRLAQLLRVAHAEVKHTLGRQRETRVGHRHRGHGAQISLRTRLTGGPRQGLVNVPQNVVNVLQPHRYAHHVGRHASGQLLLRIDARSADQSAAAVDAQVQAARAQLDVATREYERQKQLFAKKYISQAALDRAEAEVRAARAQASAQTAQAGAARTQTYTAPPGRRARTGSPRRSAAARPARWAA